MARAQFEQALPYAAVSDDVAERLSFPERAVIVSVPLRRDDGPVEIFPGYRVQHSTVLGPTKGGMRYDPDVSLGECAALATWMTGRPISIGGSVFGREATGAGVVMVTEQACTRLGFELAGRSCVVQGFGNVGGVAASELHERGARVVGVSDVSGGVHDERGLD